MDALNDHCVGTHQDAVLHNDGGGACGLDDPGEDRARADVAVLTHCGPSAENGTHVNHGPRTDDRADVDDRAHHNHRAVADGDLLADDRAGLDAGIDVFHVQEGDGAVAAVVLHDKVRDFVRVCLQNGPQVPPIAEDRLTAALAKDLGRTVINGFPLVDIDLYRRLLLRRADVGDDLLCRHHLSVPPNKISLSS